MPAATVTTRAPIRPLRSKRLLSLAGDERLVEQVRRGNELAFEVLFERHGAGILAFCRHMLGSREEAEDAVQHTFAAAYRDLQRPGERTIALKAWLYTIARNRCVSMLRTRREHAAELQELPTDGLSEQVERRAELRELLADVAELPEQQRAALLLSEAAGLTHAEVAEVLGCEVASVKGLVFRARSALIERREARETPCDDIREQLATLRGGALRRNELRHHLRGCPGCRAYRQEVRRQRQLLSAALPVAPSLGLKASVMGAAGLTGSAVGGASAGGAALGSAAVAKVALVGVLAGGSVVAGEVAIDQAMQSDAGQVAPAARGARDGAGAPAGVHPPVVTSGARGDAIGSDGNDRRQGEERRAANTRERSGAGSGGTTREERTSSAGGRALGQEKRSERPGGATHDRTRGQRPDTSTERGSGAPAEPTSQAAPIPQTKSIPAPTLEDGPATTVPTPAPAPVPKLVEPEAASQAR